MEVMPLVSVIITAYNRPCYLRETLDSIANQTYKNIEVIVVDDGSSPQNAEQIKRSTEAYNNFFYYYKKNTGQPDSRNFGIKKSKGAYIAFCDDDDFWTLDKLEQQVAILINYPEYSVISGWVDLIDSKGRRLGRQKKYSNCNTGYLFYKNLERNCLSSATPLLRKEVFEKVGYFNTNFSIGEDWEFWRRVSYYYKFYGLKRVIAYYRVHNTNMSKIKNDTINRVLLYRKLTKSLLNWGDERFTSQEKNHIKIYEYKFYRKIFINHFPSLSSKMYFFIKIILKSLPCALHILSLLFLSPNVEKK